MKASIEIEFDNRREAQAAFAVIAEDEGKASLSRRLLNNKVVFIVEAGYFTALRARTTSLLRDIYVFLSVRKLMRKNTLIK